MLPMLAKRVEEMPSGDDWIFEPKWDGFRALVFRDGKRLFIQSRDEKPLNRYFPELLEPLLTTLPERCVLDGEIVIVNNNELDFDALQLRLHPAASRVNLLSREIPFFICILRPPVQWRSRSPRRALSDATPRTGSAACEGATTYSFNTCNFRSQYCVGLVSTLRRCRPRRSDRQVP